MFGVWPNADKDINPAVMKALMRNMELAANVVLCGGPTAPHVDTALRSRPSAAATG